MGRAQRFPIGTPTEITFESQPFATSIPAGDRIVLVITGGASSLEANERQPLLTITTGGDYIGNVDLPVVEGALRFREPATPA